MVPQGVGGRQEHVLARRLSGVGRLYICVCAHLIIITLPKADTAASYAAAASSDSNHEEAWELLRTRPP